jgi:hypothetical protein
MQRMQNVLTDSGHTHLILEVLPDAVDEPGDGGVQEGSVRDTHLIPARRGVDGGGGGGDGGDGGCVCVCVCVFVCVCVRVSVLASHAELCMVIEGTLLYQWTALTSCAKKMQGRILKVNCSAPSERTTLLLLLL